MAKHVDPGTMGGAASDGGSALTTAVAGQGDAVQAGYAAQGEVSTRQPETPIGYPPYHGRTVSWVAVGIIMVGFLVGGLALITGTNGPLWWLFWVGTGLAMVGLLTMIATNTFNDWY
jgi:hypothetical protein